MMIERKAMSLTSASVLFLALFAAVLRVTTASDAVTSRLNLLEQRIESLEQLAKTQSSTIEGLLRRGLQASDDGCLPKRDEKNVCVFEKGVEFLYRNSNLVFDSSTVRFTGPIKDTNAFDDKGNKTNHTTYAFTSQVIFDSTDVLVENSNVTFTAEHDYKAFKKNETQLPQHYGFVIMNNTETTLNSSRFLVTGPDPRSLNRSLYDDLTYENLFSSIGFSYSNIKIGDSNTTFTTNSSSATDDSSIVFNYTKIMYNHSDASMRGSKTSASDSSISYGKNTNVQWFGSSSSAYFTNGADLSVENSNVRLDQSTLELKGIEGKLISRVDTEIRGPDSGDPINFKISQKVNVNYEQSQAMTIQSDVKFIGDSDVTFDSTGTLEINGKLESNDEAVFLGEIWLDDVHVHVERNLIIDGRDGNENADIEFRKGVDVRIRNDLSVDKNLDVSGHADLHSLDVSEEATVGGRLYCRKGATISGDSSTSSDSITSSFSSQLLKVDGSALIQRDLKVDGTLTAESQDFDGDVTISGNARVYSLTVDSTAKVTGTATVGTVKASSGDISGQLTAGTIKAESDIFFDNLDVSGKATVRNLDVTGATRTYDLTVDSNAVVSGTTTVRSITASSGAFSGQLTAESIKSENDVHFQNLDVSGKATIVSLGVTSDADVSGNLNVGGKLSATKSTASFKDIAVGQKAVVGVLEATNSTVQNMSVVFGKASVAGDLEVGGIFKPNNSEFENIIVSGMADVGSLKASGAVVVQSLKVDANVDIGGNLNVDGTLSDTVFNDILVIGTASIGSLTATSASISDTATIQTLNVGADADVTGTLSVGGTFAPEDTAFNDITVLGTATFTSLSALSASISDTANIQTLNVGADADVSGSLSVGGTFAPAESEFQDITVAGTATVGTLSATSASISDTATVNNLSVGSDADITGDISIGGSFSSDVLECQDITVSGMASVGSLLANNASVDGVASIEMLSVGSNADVLGDLTVAGTIIN